MRTQLILTSVAMGLAGAVSAIGQVYSVNAVGYINVTIPASAANGSGGYGMVANQLNTGGNTVAEVIPTAPDGTLLNKHTQAGGFSVNQANFGAWDRPTEVIKPGEAFFVKNPQTTPLTLTFVGEVPQGELKTPLLSGLNLVSSQVPQAGKLVVDLKFPAGDDDIIYQWDSAAQGYKAPNQLSFGAWTGGEPDIKVGEGFFVQKVAAGSWDRTFSVNP